MAKFETVTVETDLLICGGGMAACGAAVEASYWAKKNGMKVTLVDKAAIDRSGAVAMGLSAINQYVDLNSGNNTLKDYCDYVRNDLMGITREDLVTSIARHVDNTVHLFEKWGLPIWKDEEGNYVHEGRWQLMINGESYKVIVAEAAKNALTEAGGELIERVFITHPLVQDGKCVGAIGFSTREDKVYVFKAKATLVAMGGAVHVFKPRSTGEGFGRSWYPPFNSGRLRPRRCLVPALQGDRDQRPGRQLHAGERRGARQVGALRQGEASPRQHPQLAHDARCDGRQEPHLHADRRCHQGDH